MAGADQHGLFSAVRWLHDPITAGRSPASTALSERPLVRLRSAQDAHVDAAYSPGRRKHRTARTVRAGPRAHHSDLLELETVRTRIPYVKYGGLRFLEAHVKE